MAETLYPGAVTTLTAQETLLSQIEGLIKLVHEQNFQIEILIDDAMGGVPAQSPEKEAAIAGAYGAFGKLSAELSAAQNRILSTMERTISFRNRLGVNS